jgi:hypothetical protein
VLFCCYTNPATCSQFSTALTGFEELYGRQYHIDILDIWSEHTPYPCNQVGGRSAVTWRAVRSSAAQVLQAVFGSVDGAATCQIPGVPGLWLQPHGC